MYQHKTLIFRSGLWMCLNDVITDILLLNPNWLLCHKCERMNAHINVRTSELCINTDHLFYLLLFLGEWFIAHNQQQIFLACVCLCVQVSAVGSRQYGPPFQPKWGHHQNTLSNCGWRQSARWGQTRAGVVPEVTLIPWVPSLLLLLLLVAVVIVVVDVA